MVFFIKDNSQSLKIREFSEKYEPLTEGLNYDSVCGRYWIVIQLIRWITLCAVLVIMKDYEALQIVVLLIQSLIMQILLIKGKPIDRKGENNLCIFNELMTTAYLIICMGLTGIH